MTLIDLLVGPPFSDPPLGDGEFRLQILCLRMEHLSRENLSGEIGRIAAQRWAVTVFMYGFYYHVDNLHFKQKHITSIIFQLHLYFIYLV